MQMLLVQVRTLLDILIVSVLLSVAGLACKPSTEYREAGSQVRTGFERGMFTTGKRKFHVNLRLYHKLISLILSSSLKIFIKTRSSEALLVCFFF